MFVDIQTRIFNFLKKHIKNVDFIIAIDQFYSFKIRQNIANFFFQISIENSKTNRLHFKI